jgi:hypothetical protein
LAEKGGGLISMAKLAPTSRSQTERWDLVVPMAISYWDIWLQDGWILPWTLR